MAEHRNLRSTGKKDVFGKEAGTVLELLITAVDLLRREYAPSGFATVFFVAAFASACWLLV